MQNLGLSTAHSEDKQIRSYCRKLMGLALLPLEEVETLFYHLHSTASTRMEKNSVICSFTLMNMGWPQYQWKCGTFMDMRTSNKKDLWRYVSRSYLLQRLLQSIYVGFHNKLNCRRKRARANIWLFLKCIICVKKIDFNIDTCRQSQARNDVQNSTQRMRFRNKCAFSMNDTRKRK